MILILHTLIEAAVGFLFLFYPGAAELVPGFADATGDSYTLLIKMYGLAALLLAGLSLTAYMRRSETSVFLLITLALTLFHAGMTLIQFIYNGDHRAGLLHFLLLLFLAGQYINRRRVGWDKEKATYN